MVRALLTTLSILVASPVLAETVLVTPDGDGDYPTIQDALASVTDGDVIELSDGVFTGPGNRDLEFFGRAITLRSRSGDPRSCVVSAEQMGRVFHLHDGEMSATVIEDIAIQMGVGGGLVLENGASPVIRGCLIRVNDGEAEWCEYGGGVRCNGASPTFEDCAITGNTAIVGAGVSIQGGSSVSFVRCTISDNLALCVDSIGITGGAGGLYIRGSVVTLVDCLVANNRGHDGIGGIDAAGAELRFEGCTISGNTAGFGPAGIDLGTGTTVTMERTILWGNRSDELGTYDRHDLKVGHGATVSFRACAFDVEHFTVYGTVTQIADNVGQDPQFCAPEYTLASTSPCLAEHSPSGELIGALGVGCVVTPTRAVSWSRVKSRFR